CSRKVLARLLRATFGALHRRDSFACERFRLLLKDAPARRLDLRFFAFVPPRARRTRSRRGSSHRICASKFQRAKRVAPVRRVVVDRDQVFRRTRKERGRSRKVQPHLLYVPKTNARLNYRSFPIHGAAAAFRRVEKEQKHPLRKVCWRSRWPVQSAAYYCSRACSAFRFLLLRLRPNSQT